MVIILFILVMTFVTFIIYYLRRRTVKKNNEYLEGLKPMINGKIVKFGKIMEGEYQGRKVRCRIFESEHNFDFWVEMKPNRFFMSDQINTKAQEKWVLWNTIRGFRSIPTPDEVANKRQNLGLRMKQEWEESKRWVRLSKEERFRIQLEELRKFCEEAELQVQAIQIFYNHLEGKNKEEYASFLHKSKQTVADGERIAALFNKVKPQFDAEEMAILEKAKFI